MDESKGSIHPPTHLPTQTASSIHVRQIDPWGDGICFHLLGTLYPDLLDWVFNEARLKVTPPPTHPTTHPICPAHLIQTASFSSTQPNPPNPPTHPPTQTGDGNDDPDGQGRALPTGAGRGYHGLLSFCHLLDGGWVGGWVGWVGGLVGEEEEEEEEEAD